MDTNTLVIHYHIQPESILNRRGVRGSGSNTGMGGGFKNPVQDMIMIGVTWQDNNQNKT